MKDGSTAARGICAICKREVALRKDGTIRTHKAILWSKIMGRSISCDGEGERPRSPAGGAL